MVDSIPINFTDSCRSEVLVALLAMAKNKILEDELGSIKDAEYEKTGQWAIDLRQIVLSKIPEAERGFYEAQAMIDLAPKWANFVILPDSQDILSLPPRAGVDNFYAWRRDKFNQLSQAKELVQSFN